MVTKFPCKICNVAVANNHHAIICDKCHSWIDIKCSKVYPHTDIFDSVYTPGIASNVLKILFYSLTSQMMNYIIYHETNVGKKKKKFKALIRKTKFSESAYHWKTK